MRLEIIEVANGWVVRPAYDVSRDQGGKLTPMSESWVFSRFQDMTDFLAKQSAILKPAKRTKGAS